MAKQYDEQNVFRAGRQKNGRGARCLKVAVAPRPRDPGYGCDDRELQWTKMFTIEREIGVVETQVILLALARYLTAFAIVPRAYSFLSKILKR